MPRCVLHQILRVTPGSELGILLSSRIIYGPKLSEKRPETDADILSRSKVLTDAQVKRARNARRGAVQDKPATKKQQVVHPGPRYSVDLPAHMAECDANYVRLMQLFPGLRDESRQKINLWLTDLDAVITFEVLERGPYTTLLRVHVDSEQAWLKLASAPAMTVRVYHDAQSAEVVSYQAQNRFHGAYEYPNSRMRQRDEKVQINRFLGEFLTLCLSHGASSAPISL